AGPIVPIGDTACKSGTGCADARPMRTTKDLEGQPGTWKGNRGPGWLTGKPGGQLGEPRRLTGKEGCLSGPLSANWGPGGGIPGGGALPSRGALIRLGIELAAHGLLDSRLPLFRRRRGVEAGARLEPIGEPPRR